MYARTILINYTTANIKAPNASDPKWYLNALYIEVSTGACPPPFYEKYQIQAVD